MSLEGKTLIIAGASKAGTTSLFNYLAGHPQICPSASKETRFFLDKDYPLQSLLRYETNGAETYRSFFPDDGGGDELWRLEATPDYLYSPGTPSFIRTTVPCARFIFLLREPISRLLSFYRFGQTMREIPRELSFDRYVDVQRNGSNAESAVGFQHPAFAALAHGRYSTYLRLFLELFGKSCVHVAFHEDLARSPLEVMEAVCRFVQIDKRYFEDYSFEVANKGVSVRSSSLHNAYWLTKQKIRSCLRSAPKVRSMLRRVGSRIDAVYEKTNVADGERIIMSSSTEKFIRNYYREEPARLQEMLGREVPWSVRPSNSEVNKVTR